MLLTPAQLRTLTGYQRPSAVRRWLDKQQWPYVVGRDGWPRVLREVVDAELGGGDKMTGPSEPQLRL